MNEVSNKPQLEYDNDNCQKQETWIKDTVMGRIFKGSLICIASNFSLNSSTEKYLIISIMIST